MGYRRPDFSGEGGLGRGAWVREGWGIEGQILVGRVG